MIKEKVTGLESYAICPYKYKHVPFDGSNIKTFEAVNVGDIVHLAHQYPDMADIMADIFFDDTLPTLTGSKNNIAKKQIHNIIALARNRIKEYDGYEKFFEVKNTININGVIVTGSYDCLVKEPDPDVENGILYHLIEFKTTSNLDYYSNWIEKKQIMLYGYMIMKKFNIEKIKVTYQIYVKGKDNIKATAERKSKILYLKKAGIINQIDYIDDIESKVFTIIDNYKLSSEMDYWRPSPKNEDGSDCSHCWFCPLRNAESAADIGMEICPAKKDNSKIDIDGEIDFSI
ncbi:MAG TPA: PD-(D/E)XK nuclease family protein [Candidatus Absconditabacterales bacterium]|nr:PD-(D/E)XK nuclease family protein [Candidatus Absconditabacterales bacterium]